MKTIPIIFLTALGILIASCTCKNSTKSTESQIQCELIFDKGEKITNTNFTGNVWLKNLINPESLNQFFRQVTPNTGPFDTEIVTKAMSALFDKTGEGILITHSQGGLPGWTTAVSNNNVKAVVSYEPGTYLFPEGELPAPITGRTGTLTGIEVSLEDFQKLTQIPIILYFGDNIGKEVTNELGAENWRIRLTLGKQFVETINRHGGDATLIELPEIGIYGNTHFPMADLNNGEIANLLSEWLKEKGLDKKHDLQTD